MLNTLPRPKTRDLVAEQLKDYITREQLAPGDRLPTETELAAMFGVNRLTLREATKSLGYLGVVEARPGRGLTVGQLNLERVTDLLEFHPDLRDASPLALIRTRVIVETGVLPYVAERMQSDDAIADELLEVNDQLRKARTLKGWVELDIEFHRRLVEASGVTPLLAFNQLLAVFFRKFRDSVKKAEWKTGIDSHQRLIDKLQRGDVSSAERELRRHIESHIDRIDAVA